MLSILVLAIGMQQIGLAWGRKTGKMPARPDAAAGFFNDSSLTKAQRERIAALQRKHFLEIAPLRQKLAEAILAYRQTQVLHPEDEAALAAKRNAVKEARQALRLKLTGFRTELMQILTPEQRAKLHEAGFGGWGAPKGRCHGSDCGR
ncbi:MAG: Spy/CpxP family protein refolding chaperone [Bacteroidota bacterium]